MSKKETRETLEDRISNIKDALYPETKLIALERITDFLELLVDIIAPSR